MLELSRGYVAYLLSGFGEPEVAAAIIKSSESQFQKVQAAANQGAQEGKEWLKIACRAAVEIIEGKPRELKYRQLIGNMPQEFVAEDLMTSAARTRAFSGGTPVKKREIFAGMAVAIAAELPDYRYSKVNAQFTKPFSDGTFYVTLHRGKGIVYLSFGVTHDEIQSMELSVFGPRTTAKKAILFPQTLLVLSVNISPRAHYWPHPHDASWLILGDEGIQLASSEAVQFVRDLVVPFLDHNRTPACIRETLLSTRGRIASMRAAQTVFSTDCLEHRRDCLDADLAVFMERYQDYPQEARDILQSEYQAAVASLERSA
jgi:hypothetical protein